ncbi:hypothetical protein ACIRO3_34685 [Streptomyces sp. NPDC102278]|uniref:hypothetical protein n=1 Tax=Streptomyces sp. NPDC102278 TaxID=3366152 RepID=UPI0037F8B0BD
MMDMLPQAPRPELPGAEEMFHALASSVRPVGDGQSVVASAIDPRVIGFEIISIPLPWRRTVLPSPFVSGSSTAGRQRRMPG